MNSDDPLVTLSHVSFSYPLPGGESRPALRDFSLAIRPGESLVVLGANGAGKSTLAALLAGVVPPTEGTVARAVAGAAARPVLPAGLVTQNPEDCFSSPIVLEEMGVVLENLGRDLPEIERTVDEMLAEIGLAGHAQSHPGQLSGGQKQLLAIASVLIAEPPLLVLDEPLTLLDGPGRAEAEKLLARTRAEGSATVFFTSEVEEAARGERVLILHRGSVVWEGSPRDLPLDAVRLGVWGLVPPDRTVPGVALHAAGHSVSPPYRNPEEYTIDVKGGLRPQGTASPVPGPLNPPVFPVAKGGSREEGVRVPSRPARYVMASSREPVSAQRHLPMEGGGQGWGGPCPVTITDLHFSYAPRTAAERAVLRGIDLVARPGEILGIIGAIGSGKTTLIQHLNGLLPPQRGRITVGDCILEPGVKIKQLLHREVGLVFQFPEKQLFAETVVADIAAGPEFAGFPEDEIPGRVRAVLERVGLDPVAYGQRPPFTLTWGEKRLVAIAGVLVLDTPCLAFDEPGAGLDPVGRRRIGALLVDLAHRERKTIVVVSHQLADLFRMADRVAVLHKGRIAFCGTTAELLVSGGLGLWGIL